MSSETGPALLTFEEAAARLHSAVTVSSLRRARVAGQLWAKKIGKRYFTTWAAITEFLQCPDPDCQPASTSARTSGNGLSATATPNSGQALALNSVARLKQLSRTTSQPESRPSAEVRHFRGS